MKLVNGKVGKIGVAARGVAENINRNMYNYIYRRVRQPLDRTVYQYQWDVIEQIGVDNSKMT